MNNKKRDKMNGRVIIITVLILFKVIGIASSAKAEDVHLHEDVYMDVFSFHDFHNCIYGCKNNWLNGAVW